MTHSCACFAVVAPTKADSEANVQAEKTGRRPPVVPNSLQKVYLGCPSPNLSMLALWPWHSHPSCESLIVLAA